MLSYDNVYLSGVAELRITKKQFDYATYSYCHKRRIYSGQ